ncbi:hypothetical protein SDC9_123930 [bioreactor metagenome]|uniref:Uncharacterized protein n=1 Tax=bioreactor metagenome TaxID=1076179 RepID=A0A645CJ04_9ZZZZ
MHVIHVRTEGDRIHPADPAVDDTALKTSMDGCDLRLLVGVLLVRFGTEAGQSRCWVRCPRGIGSRIGDLGSSQRKDGSIAMGNVVAGGEHR